MYNLLADYSDIITTYLEGVRWKYGVDFEFELQPSEGSVYFTTYSKGGLKVHLKYTIDKQDLEKEDPSAKFLKTALRDFKSEVLELLKVRETADAL